MNSHPETATFLPLNDNYPVCAFTPLLARVSEQLVSDRTFAQIADLESRLPAHIAAACWCFEYRLGADDSDRVDVSLGFRDDAQTKEQFLQLAEPLKHFQHRGLNRFYERLRQTSRQSGGLWHTLENLWLEFDAGIGGYRQAPGLCITLADGGSHQLDTTLDNVTQAFELTTGCPADCTRGRLVRDITRLFLTFPTDSETELPPVRMQWFFGRDRSPVRLLTSVSHMEDIPDLIRHCGLPRAAAATETALQHVAAPPGPYSVSVDIDDAVTDQIGVNLFYTPVSATSHRSNAAARTALLQWLVAEGIACPDRVARLEALGSVRDLHDDPERWPEYLKIAEQVHEGRYSLFAAHDITVMKLIVEPDAALHAKAYSCGSIQWFDRLTRRQLPLNALTWQPPNRTTVQRANGAVGAHDDVSWKGCGLS